MENLQGKCVVLGVSGGIAAYKTAYVASALHKAGADVHAVMTENATKFITPLTFETLTNNKCTVDTFDRNFKYDVHHISLAKAADLIVIAPATANVIAKLAHGIADDMLTTVVLASKCRKIIAPAMNTAMLENPITQDNIERLRDYGFEIVPSAEGYLACGDTGSGKMPEPEVICDYICRELACVKDMQGIKLAVSAGPTREALDPVRFLSNKSSGKMGYAIARAAMLRGAEVTLISGQTALKHVPFVRNVSVTSTHEMYEAFKSVLDESDIIIKAAAVADYKPLTVAENKIKKHDGNMSIELERTEDIISYCAAHRHEGLYICGFSMETEQVIANSKAKLEKKNLDMIVANNVKQAGAGFQTDTNIVTLITRDGAEELPLMTKDETAHRILDEIMRRRK